MLPGEEVHVLIGGPPCQGFSFLGKRSLEDERNACVLDFLRIVEELQPWAVGQRLGLEFAIARITRLLKVNNHPRRFWFHEHFLILSDVFQGIPCSIRINRSKTLSLDLGVVATSRGTRPWRPNAGLVSHSTAPSADPKDLIA